MRFLVLGFPWVLATAAPAAWPGLGRTPYHSAADAVARPGEAVTLEAWFSRGSWVQKDVDGAQVRAEIQMNGAWASLGETRTDEGGRAELVCEAPRDPGRHRVRWHLGDRRAEAVLQVLKGGESATVFDIDGTLTPSDREVLKDYARRMVRKPRLRGPALRPHALETARSAAGEGLVVYLTGRPTWLGAPTRDWLKHHGFPEGPVFWMPVTRDIWPSESRVGRAKAERLQALKAAGITLQAAYGNATTDITAYEAAGIPKHRTYILGKRGGERSTRALGEAFPAPAAHPQKEDRP